VDDERKVSICSSWMGFCAWMRSLLCSLFKFAILICATQRLSQLNSRVSYYYPCLVTRSPFILPMLPRVLNRVLFRLFFI